MPTFSQSLQQEPDVHPAPCWFPYYGRCTCFDGPPLPKAAARDDLLDEYGRADTTPLGTLPELRAKLDAIRAEVHAELEQQAAAATEYRVPAPDGTGLYVRRAPGGTGWAVFEPRGHRGRRAWTRDGWQLFAILAHSELHCWPDAATALAEARKALGAEGGAS